MKNKKFEYGFISIDEDFGFYIFKGDRINKINSSHRVYNIEDALDSLGDKGWELCGRHDDGRYMFKRELIEEEADVKVNDEQEADNNSSYTLKDAIAAIKNMKLDIIGIKLYYNGESLYYSRDNVGWIKKKMMNMEVDYIKNNRDIVEIYLKEDK